MKKVKWNKKATIILVLLVVGFSYSFKSNFFEVAKQIEIYTALFKELNMYYVDEINPAELTSKAIKNTLKDLDPYTNYYNEQDVEEAKINREGEYAGIGVSVYYDKKGITINEVYKGFSADKSQLKAGDIITKVDGQPLQNLENEQLSEFLKGTPNTLINLEVDRQGKKLQFAVNREKVTYNPVPFFDMIDEETGYVVLTRFNLKASLEVKKAYRKLEERGMKQLVFDLRGNPGGSLGEAINISNFFLPKNSPIVSTKGKVKSVSVNYKGTNDPLSLKIPIVVLINGSSASASEIVSGALQDYDRAVIMGERSFGKGLVQRYRELSYGTQLKVTISKYYTPSGRCIQELDYANRDKNGNVPKFSDGTTNEFKTKNGRTVFDGGGITPDVTIRYKNITESTKLLLNSRAIFNFGTDYYHKNNTIASAKEFSFTDQDFKDFQNYLLNTDTTFVIKEEKLFKDAYESTTNNKIISKEYRLIKTKLKNDKVQELEKNKEYINTLLEEDVLTRYYYQKGSFENKIQHDKVILNALRLLNNKSDYNKILAAK